jgi:hypothetical protein
MRRKRLVKIIGTLLLVAAVALVLQMCMDSRQKTKAYEASLGTWQEAYESGTLISSKLKGLEDGHRVDSRYYDVTADGVPDLEITMMWGSPYKWRYMKDGKSYG